MGEKLAVLSVGVVAFAGVVIMLLSVYGMPSFSLGESNNIQGNVVADQSILSTVSKDISQDSTPDTNSWCRENDGGVNFNRKGIKADITGTYYDRCLNDVVLREYYCAGDTDSGYKDHECDYSCYDGACVYPSDNGLGGVTSGVIISSKNTQKTNVIVLNDEASEETGLITGNVVVEQIPDYNTLNNPDVNGLGGHI